MQQTTVRIWTAKRRLTLAQVQADVNTAQADDNYAYDEIGNLIKDTKEGITKY
jgi:hypothetical protein